jgi:phage tail tube protein FII
MTIFTGSITNADVLMNGIDVAGRVKGVDLGDVGHEEIEHKTLGSIGVLKLPTRALSPIEATSKYEWLDPDLKRQVLLPTKTHDLQLHQYVDVSGPDGLDLTKSHQLVTHVGFRSLKTKQGESSLGEGVEMEQNWSIVKIIQKVFGEEDAIMEFDFFNGVHKIDGKDVWPRYT